MEGTVEKKGRKTDNYVPKKDYRLRLARRKLPVARGRSEEKRKVKWEGGGKETKPKSRRPHTHTPTPHEPYPNARPALLVVSCTLNRLNTR